MNLRVEGAGWLTYILDFFNSYVQREIKKKYEGDDVETVNYNSDIGPDDLRTVNCNRDVEINDVSDAATINYNIPNKNDIVQEQAKQIIKKHRTLKRKHPH